tara:strand:+ start:616 stop:1068 length:453 start_codon:yes stop_codon:yes gene_type:complete
MIKKIILIFAFLLATGCGYTPLYSTKNFDFKVKNITSSKNSRLDSKVERGLRRFSNQKGQKIISLKMDTKKEINILSKDSKGDPSRYEMIISIELETLDYQNRNINRSFKNSFNYNNKKNKFDFKKYENEIEDLLIDKNIDLIVIFLSKI